MRRTNRFLAAASISALFAGALVISPVTALGEDAQPGSEPTDTQASPAQSADVSSAVSEPEPAGNLSECDIQGTPNNDKLEGKDRGEVICGMGGNDTIYGMGGPDELRGGPGKDTLLGGGADDDLLGGDQEDTCKQHKGSGELNSCEWPSPIEKCPVKNGTVYNDFGAPRGDHRHEGNDILAKKGEPVLATMNGTASREYASGAGYYVVVMGKRGFTYNMHVLEQGRASGKVQVGDVIAKVGSTGNAGSTNHLHFEWHFRENGDYWNWPAVDPFPYLKKVCDRTANMPSSEDAHRDAEAADYTNLAVASEELL